MDCKRQYAGFENQVKQCVMRVLDSGYYLLGSELQSFESEFAKYHEVDHAIGVANGTDAIEIALHALECPAGSSVITVANAGMYSSTAILRSGASPRFVDVDPATALPTTEAVIDAIDSDTSGVIFTHLYGAAADLTRLRNEADARGLFLIEDCAQAHGAVVGGKKAGSMGHAATFSFYPTKNLGAMGDAGAVVTCSQSVNDRARSLRQYGWSEKYVSQLAGGRNSRLDEIQAAILRLKLHHLHSWTWRRREIHSAYEEAARDSEIEMLNTSGEHFVSHLAIAIHPDRDTIRQKFSSWSIDTAVHYPVPDHRQQSLEGQFSIGTSLDNSDLLCSRVLTLPCFPEMTDGEVQRIQQCIRSIG
jgi:dTDP-4-amino-4,6-dideoxygalactose transaminase